mmetsp:Transcript_21075/g.56763  ORF Transcript_21075/g.56763 Transcript_21075/m.56763 type:complete len:234 (+) Transcript_21075:17-718(+)
MDEGDDADLRVLDAYKLERKYREEVLAAYYKREEDFDTPDEYDEYLMEVEDLVHSLVHQEGVAATRAKLAEYKRAFGELSAANRSRRQVTYRQLVAEDEREQQEREQRRAQQREAEEQRLRGIVSTKLAEQESIAQGRGVPDALLAGRRTAQAAARGFCEADLVVDTAAVPAHMREQKQEARQAPAAQGTAVAAADAAAAAAGFSMLLWLRYARDWATQGDALVFEAAAGGGR